jgi:hypothetical protein
MVLSNAMAYNDHSSEIVRIAGMVDTLLREIAAGRRQKTDKD